MKILNLTKSQLMEKVLENTDGEAILDAISAEHSILERMGLIHGYCGDNNDVYFDVPDWNALMFAARAFIASYKEI